LTGVYRQGWGEEEVRIREKTEDNMACKQCEARNQREIRSRARTGTETA
jgi:hypothetical protein